MCKRIGETHIERAQSAKGVCMCVPQKLGVTGMGRREGVGEGGE